MYRLPEYYYGVPEIDELLKRLEGNDIYFNELLKRAQKEIYVSTGECEGLDIWSKILLSSKTKQDILTKLRGTKTITKLNLAYIVKEILKQDTPVEVTEQNNINRILLGIHDNNNDSNVVQENLKQELKLIIPAHLELLVYFNSLIWIKYDAYDKNWNEWDRLDLTWNEFERYNESV